MKVKGNCLCQSVKFTFDAKGKSFEACHCTMCRSWGGGPSLTVGVQDSLKIEGEENITIYDSSDWAQRGFCKKCGSNLFYRLKNHPFCNFNLGVIEGHENFEFETQIYVDAKPGNYSFSNQTKMMTEKEVIESFESEN